MDDKNQLLASPDQPSKLTDWKKEPTLQQLKSDLEAARPAQQAQNARIQGWNDLMNVTGKARPPQNKGRSSVQPKLIRRQAEWRYSALSEPFLGSNKLFSVKPVTYEDTDAARQNELVLNWQFRTKFNRVKFIDDFVRATVDEGTSIIQLGWDRVTVKVWEEVPIYEHYPLESEEQAQLFQQALTVRQENPREYNETAPAEVKAALDYYDESGEATYAVENGKTKAQVEKVLVNQPTVEVKNPNNVIIDPSCNGDLSKAMFIIVSFETHKAELLKNKKRYKNLDKINWEDAAPITNPDHETKTPNDFQFNDPMRKKVVAHEYWGYQDINDDGEMIPFVATWIGNTLIRMELNPFPDEKLPFVVVPYLPVKRDLYGEPDAELLEDNQKILGAVTRGMIDIMGRSANGQQGFAKGMLDPLNRRRYDNGQDYEFNPNNSPNQGMIEHKFPEIPQSAVVMLNLQNQEAEALTGVKSFGGGISGEAFGDVAAGIRGVLDAASKREMAILRRLAKGMTEIGNKIVAMNSQFLSEKEVVRVTNDEFVEVMREDIQGNFDLEVDISTAEVDNAKSQDLAFMLQTLGPKSDPMMVFMILAEIAELKRMPALAHKLRNYKPPEPTPEQKEMAQLELAEKRASVQLIESEVALNQAKAKKESAEADIKNLDFVEQETGTKHARDLQKQAGQAKGNQQLEVTKALVKPKKEGESNPDIDAAIGFNAVGDKLTSPEQQSLNTSTIQRDLAAQQDPALSLRSAQFDPSQDPALNPNLTIS